ncbi:MAG: hypothetical protein R6W06_02960 [Prochlorococcaceae cyanobacterium]
MLIPEAGPLITLAYAESLDLLLKPGWPLAMEQHPRRGVFLFEDHKIARATSLLPPSCLKVTPRA